MIVVDASAILELLLDTPAAPDIETRLLGTGESLHAPHLLDLEVVQALRRYVSVGELMPQRGEQALSDLALISRLFAIRMIFFCHAFGRFVTMSAPMMRRIWRWRNRFRHH